MKKGPFKMNPGFDMLPKKVQDKMTKKSPAEHNTVGMLGGRNYLSNGINAVVGGNKPSRGNMLGALGGAINFPSVTGGGGGRNKRRGMGALNAFRNRIRGIFG